MARPKNPFKDGDPVDILMKELNDMGGEQVAFKLKDEDPVTVKDFISTGSTLVDYAVSNRRDGGIPIGRITHISGKESVGKSVMGATIIKNAQKKGGIGVLLDTERAVDAPFYQRLGVDLSKMLWLKPDTIEKCYENIDRIIAKTEQMSKFMSPVVIVWDSVGGTPANAILEGSFDPTKTVAMGPRIHSNGLQSITQAIADKEIALVLLNQLITNIGAGPFSAEKYSEPGGRKIRHHITAHIRLKPMGELTNGKTGLDKVVLGNKVKAQINKTRLGPPKRLAEFSIKSSSGIDDLGSIRDFLVDKKVAKKTRGIISMDDQSGNKIQVNSREWNSYVEKDEEFKKYLFDLLEKLCVVQYEQEEIDEDAVETDDDF